MHFLRAIVEEGAHIVAQLRAAHDGVVTEHDALSLENGGIGDEFHARHQVAARLTTRGKRPRPCRRVLQNSTLVGNLFAVGIAHRHTHARIGNAADQVSLHLRVLLAHYASVLLAHRLGVDALIVAGRKTVVDPEERTDLTTAHGLLQHLDAVCTQPYDFPRPHIAQGLIVEVGKTRCLARCGIGTVALSEYDGCATEHVACGNDAVLRQYQHGARSFDFPVHPVDAVHERVAHIDKQCHEFRLVDGVGRHLAQVHTAGQQFVGNLPQVVDFSHRDHCIASQMRIDNDGLRVGIADNPHALTSLETVQLVFKARAEIVAFQRVDGTVESAFRIVGHHSCALRAQVRVVVCTVEHVVHTVLG